MVRTRSALRSSRGREQNVAVGAVCGGAVLEMVVDVGEEGGSEGQVVGQLAGGFVLTVPDALTVTLEVTVIEVVDATQEPVYGLPDGPDGPDGPEGPEGPEGQDGVPGGPVTVTPGKVTVDINVEMDVDVTVTVLTGPDVEPPGPLEVDGPPLPDKDTVASDVTVEVVVEVVVIVTTITAGGGTTQLLDAVGPETVTVDVDGGGHPVVERSSELVGEELVDVDPELSRLVNVVPHDINCVRVVVVSVVVVTSPGSVVVVMSPGSVVVLIRPGSVVVATALEVIVIVAVVVEMVVCIGQLGTDGDVEEELDRLLGGIEVEDDDLGVLCVVDTVVELLDEPGVELERLLLLLVELLDAGVVED
ncbi:hypothetical protein B0J11DRAFT_570276 [Dendryphion nanum]|uniref:Uncharacterized protein n=1 Tax=Dendryphion nanum TaxID=256645 RepID=A0A9P9IHU4_9PLEO|nr:hypothetical protein B0J11DRAFT_570276 [Dendryphion nanum]